jgi:hypothetical protein
LREVFRYQFNGFSAPRQVVSPPIPQYKNSCRRKAAQTGNPDGRPEEATRTKMDFQVIMGHTSCAHTMDTFLPEQEKQAQSFARMAGIFFGVIWAKHNALFIWYSLLQTQYLLRIFQYDFEE